MSEQPNTRTRKKIPYLLWLIGILATFGGNIHLANSQSQVDKEIDRDNYPSAKFLPVGRSDRWALIFHDEFNGAALDQSVWTNCYWWDWQDRGCTNAANNELEWYTPRNILVSEGTLKLRAREQAIRNSEGEKFMYTSGMVTSGPVNLDSADSPGFAFQYGYVEARARIPRGEGLWPALWLLPANLGSHREIDIFEFLGHDPFTVQMHYHYTDEGGYYRGVGESWAGPDFSRGWHIFGLDWNLNYITWYVDGVERWRAEGPHLPKEPMYLVMNLAVGGDWPGSPTADTPFPSVFEIDYIRVWKQISRE